MVLGVQNKNVYDSWFTAYWVHDEIFGDMLYNMPTIPRRRVFKYKDKNPMESFAVFLNCAVIRPNQTFHIKYPEAMRSQLNKTSDRLIYLVKEIDDINKYKIELESYFLYDVSNVIEGTFFNELNKKIQIYGLISYFSDDKKILQS